MSWTRCLRRLILTATSAALLIAGFALANFQPTSLHAGQPLPSQDPTASQKSEENPLIIDTDPNLPDAFPRRNYQIRFTAHGGIGPLLWQREAGALPPGLKLDPHGFLHGEPERGGEFRFTLSVTDSGSPRQSVQRQFLIRVRSAFNLNWKNPARVEGNRIDGSVEVSNTTPDDIDLTFVVLAVASNGRATAIGYQHFPLPHGATEQELPFGDTLPRGSYVVNVDVIGEVAARNLIYRERLQTPGRLQVTVGP